MSGDVKSQAQTESYPTRDGVLRYLVDRGVITPGTREWDVVRTIAALPPPLLSVRGAACALSLGIHTLIRIMRRGGLPSPAKWVVLARALRAQRAILSGATIHEAAIAAGYCHQTGLSSVLQRTTGFRASTLRVITWRQLVDIWIASQRRRGALVTPPAPVEASVSAESIRPPTASQRRSSSTVIVETAEASHREASMHRESDDRARESHPTGEDVLRYLVEHGMLTSRSREAEILRMIAALPPALLGVRGAACALSVSRRTLGRVMGEAGLPSPAKWVVLARALRAHRVLLSGGTVADAAVAAGYDGPFTLSNALHRATGFRPTALRAVGWQHLVDAWIARQRHRGALVTPANRPTE